MRTTLNLDPELLAEIQKDFGENDKGRALNKVMAEHVRRRKIEQLIASRGAFPDMIDRTEEWEEEELKAEMARLERWSAE